MGSHFKGKVLEEQVAEIIKQWHAEVRERRKKQEQPPSPSLRASWTAEWSPRKSILTDSTALLQQSRLGEGSSTSNGEIEEVEGEERVRRG